MTPIEKYIEANKDDFISMTQEQLDQLHSLLLTILCEIDHTCKRLGLTYFLTGGTAIGALRNGKFIPWDEDADIVMPRKDLEILKKEFQNRHDSRFILDAPNTDKPSAFCYPKLRLSGTLVRELVTDDDSCEVFVDIFPLENVSNNKFARALQTHFLTFLRDISYDILFSQQYKKKFTKQGLKRCDKASRIALYLGYLVGKLMSVVPLHKWVNLYDRLASHGKESQYVSIPSGLHGPAKETYTRDIYFPPKLVTLEGYPFPVPNRFLRIMLELPAMNGSNTLSTRNPPARYPRGMVKN